MLRHWLRGESADPIDEAMCEVLALFPACSGTDGGTIVIAFRTGQGLDALLPSLKRLIKGTPTP
ncbi:hypothetical protein [Streptomyces somaliensis]